MRGSLTSASAPALGTPFTALETLRHVALIALSLVVLLPFYLMLSYSLKSPSEIMTGGGGFLGSQTPFVDTYCVVLGGSEADCLVHPVVYNYRTAFREAPLLRYLVNGAVVTASIFLLQILVALPCAYALAKLRFRGRDAVFAFVLFSLLVPVHAIALPLYVLFAKLGLINTYAALVVPWTISAFGIFLMRQFFMTVPDELIDAARLDGMSELGIVWRVMVPVAVPALLAFAIFSVVAHWNDYFWPRLVVTGDRNLFTPPLGLREFRGGADGDDFGPMMATATVIVTPLVAAFLLAQRRFIEGIALTGMK